MSLPKLIKCTDFHLVENVKKNNNTEFLTKTT